MKKLTEGIHEKQKSSSLHKSLKFKGNSNKFEKIGTKATSPFSRI